MHIDYPISQVNKECIEYAARRADISPYIVAGILAQEGGTVGKRHYNSNGTYDIGPMQINSIWLATLARYGVAEPDILYNGCANVYVGTWILRQEINRSPGNLPQAVGSYHSKTAIYRDRYLKSLSLKLSAMLRGDLSIYNIINRANNIR
jgi:soluble lytic murein transglycosylase-like protein